uniref:Uncharacterized protein n=1 Tax=Panagrolaimus superbus TaxID=310955 RepID=A0A914YFP8_9BILA
MEGIFPIRVSTEQINVFRKLILYELLSEIDQKDVFEDMHEPKEIFVDEPKDFEDVCDGLYETPVWNSKSETTKFEWITDAVIDKTAELQAEYFGPNAEIQASFLSKCG